MTNEALAELRSGKRGVCLRRVYGDYFTQRTFSIGLSSYLRTGPSSVELLAMKRMGIDERFGAE